MASKLIYSQETSGGIQQGGAGVLGSLTVTGLSDLQGDVQIGGSLQVEGTTTIVDSTTIQLEDPIIDINRSASSVAASGIRAIQPTGSAPNQQIVYKSATDRWEAGPEGSEKALLTGYEFNVAGDALSWDGTQAITLPITSCSSFEARNVLTLAGDNVTAFDDDGTLSANSDTRLATQRAIKEYVDAVPDGDVVGPASATDNAIAVYSGTTGKLVQNSAATIVGSSLGVSDVAAATITENGSSGVTVEGGARFKDGTLVVAEDGVSFSPSITVDGVLQDALVVSRTNNVKRNYILQGFGASEQQAGDNVFARARGTAAAPLICQDSDLLGVNIFAGFDGTDYAIGGRIRVEVDGTPSAGIMPSRMYFQTTDSAGGQNINLEIKPDRTVSVAATLTADTINETTPAAGVTIDGVLVQDSGITLAAGPAVDTVVTALGSGTDSQVPTAAAVDAALDGLVAGPASSTDAALALFDGASGELLQDSGTTLDTDVGLAADSDSRVATQRAVKAYVDDAPFVSAPGAVVDSAVPLYDGTTGLFLKDSGATLDTDGTLAANSDTRLATQRAVKTYVDTRSYANLYVSTSANTSIPGAGTWVKVAGATTVDIASADMTAGTNRITYTGTDTKVMRVDYDGTLINGGGNDDYLIGVSKNGADPTGGSVIEVEFNTAADPINISGHWLVSMATNDYLEVWVQNTTDGSDIELSRLIFSATC